MTQRTPALSVIAGALALAAAACQVEQPPAQCPVAHTAGFAKYKLISADDEAACGHLTGDIVGFSKYRAPGSDEARVLIRTTTLAELELYDDRWDPDRDAANSLGDFSRFPEDGVCTAPELSPGTASLPAEGTEPAVEVTYQWRNLVTVSTTNVPGTQWTAELEYEEAGCKARYEVVGVAPAVPCMKLDADGVPEEDVDGNPIPDDSLCLARRDAAGEIQPACNEFVECLNPDFRMKCDPVDFHCTPDGAVPSLLAADERPQ